MAAAKYFTIILVPAGTESRRDFRIRQWVLRLIIVGFSLLLVVMIAFFLFYGKVIARAAISDRLEQENQQLLRYQYKVKLLEANLDEARNVVTRLAALAGFDYEFPDFPDDSTFFAALDDPGEVSLARSALDDLTVPSGMPTKGFISQDFEVEDAARYHCGIDIACGEGTPVLATASGRVVRAEFDATYGHIVVIRHNDSVETVYGHNRQLLVEVDQEVLVGARIALSGSTGVSTAPHLHYEVRIHDKPIDPMGFPSYEETN